MINQQLSRFATHENSAYPQLWRGCVGAWCPTLGPSGSRLHDFSRQQQWGTFTNMDPATDWVVDNGAYCFDLDGSDDYVAIDNLRYPSGNQVFSISYWIKYTTSQASYRLPIGLGTDAVGGNQAYFIYRNPSTTYLVAEFGSGTGAANSTSALALGEWVHLCGTYDGASNRLYRAGLQIASAAYSSANITGSRLWLGAVYRVGDNAIVYQTACQMDDVRLYRRVLHPSEVRLLARRRGIAFTPRARRLAVPEQAAGGATPWLYARRRSQIIGAGGVH